VSTLFADERQKMRELVEEARALSPSDAQQKALPAVGAPPPSNPNPFVDVESEPRLRFGVVPKEDEPSRRVIEVSIPPPPPPDRTFTYIMAAAAAVLLGVIAIVATSKPEATTTDSKPYEPPVRPTTPAAPSASYKEPEEVTIDIRVNPISAKLFVDGVAVTNPHRTRVVPAAFKHSIRAEADGYETRTQTVAFDKERSIEIALLPAEKKPGFAPPPPSSAPPRRSAEPVKIPLPPGNVNP
jgi:hypothetical protein